MSASQQALEQALAEGLASIQRQLGEVQNSFASVQRALGQASGDRLAMLLPALLQLQATGAALAASVEAVLRFAGNSLHWMGAAATLPAPGPMAAVAPPPPPVTAAPPPAPAVVEAPPPVAAAPPPPPLPPSPAVEAPPRPRRWTEGELDKLPGELKDLHKKARRFAKVTVQELVMYKKDEVAKGRQNKDLYQRFRDEIDKSKAIYDQRFAKIAEHNIDYLYDEMVRVLGENDPSVLGNYPYPIPPRD